MSLHMLPHRHILSPHASDSSNAAVGVADDVFIPWDPTVALPRPWADATSVAFQASWPARRVGIAVISIASAVACEVPKMVAKGAERRR